jgi:hypothetical protein
VAVVVVVVQVLNVYEPKYESAASFWPSIHLNVIIALIIKHITLIGLFSVKKAFASTPFLIPLPIITIMFHLFCSQKFYPAFRNYPLQVRLTLYHTSLFTSLSYTKTYQRLRTCLSSFLTFRCVVLFAGG